ncbi:MAG: CCDC34 family protein [Elusimicrobiota bacterium]|jgi:hypothetical protein|nr:CCDC34 family protein [Elusimicrobiota bacterium]
MKIFVIILIAFFICSPLVWSQKAAAASEKSNISEPGQSVKNVIGADNQNKDSQLSASATEQVKTVTFEPASARDPFLSKDEIASIERMRQDEIKRIEQERKRLLDAERARLAELEEKRRRDEELRKNPAKEIIGRISIDGIVGSEAIINGKFRKIGDTVLGAKVTRVSDTSVTFVYKGQTFVKKIKISGIGVL